MDHWRICMNYLGTLYYRPQLNYPSTPPSFTAGEKTRTGIPIHIYNRHICALEALNERIDYCVRLFLASFLVKNNHHRPA